MIHPNQKHAIENALKYLAVVREELVKWPKVDTNKALTYTSLAIESSNVSLWHAGEIDFGLGCKLAEAIGGLHALRTHLESGPMWGAPRHGSTTSSSRILMTGCGSWKAALKNKSEGACIMQAPDLLCAYSNQGAKPNDQAIPNSG